MNDRLETDSSDDADESSLDEAWSAFGQMLAAVHQPLDQNRLVQGVCVRLERARQVRHRRFATAMALAAALLLAVVLRWPYQQAHVHAVKAAGQPDVAWHDELEDAIFVARSDLSSMEAEMFASLEPADWLQEQLEILRREIERSPL